MPAEDKDPKAIALRATLDQRLGEVQLPAVIQQVNVNDETSGNQVGNGNGKTLATIVSATGGTYAGNKVKQSMKTVPFMTYADT